MGTYTGTDNKDYLHGNAGPDTIYGRGGDDQIYGSGGSDWLYGEDGDDFISLVYSIAPSDVVRAFGGADNDLFYISLNGQGAGRFEADGGDGNDVWWFLSLYSVGAVLTLGQGRDSIRIAGGYQARDGAMITVADFTAGDSGDRIEWDYHLYHKLAGWDRMANPFAVGYLRLAQSGADTLLDIDYDGPGGPGGFVTLITFQNVTAGALTAQNLGGYASNGGGLVGLTLAGRERSDDIRGSAAADLIEGLGGNDKIQGVLGDDVLVGGDGNDDLRGDEGDDTLRGGADNDTLVGGAGNDEMLGGDGDDVILSYDGGTDEIYGEEGNDTITFDQGSTNPSTGSFVSGGSGDDKIIIRFSAAGGTATFDAGEGADLVTLGYVYETSISVTLGAGIDRLKLERDATPHGITVVEDFAPASGETIDWLAYLAGDFREWDGGSNPFANGMARLVQDGANTLLQVDEYGGDSWGWANYRTLITFKNVNASLFTAVTMGGYAPDGSVPAALSLTGTVADERFDGGVGADTIEGAGGKDTMFGSAGHDTLRGGDGDDTLNGELGDDLLEGGDGADVLDGGSGRDRLYGGEGDDRLAVGQSGASDHLYGEGGNDTLFLHFWSYSGGPHTVQRFASGGTGDDTINVHAGTYSNIVIEGNEGSDTIVLQEVWASTATLTLGAGRDTVRLDRYYRHTNAIEVAVTDFVAGVEGDMVDWDGHLGSSLNGWNKVTNPFSLGYVRLLQSGSDTLVQLDWDAGGTVTSFLTILTLKNVAASTLVAANFDGFDPQAPFLINGTDGADTLSGSTGRDSVNGGGGNDFIRLEQGGDDEATGGDGQDGFFFGAALTSADKADGGSDRDYVALQGDYAALTLGSGLVSWELMTLLSGSDTRFGLSGTDRFSYNIVTHDANATAAGGIVVVDAGQLLEGENLSFDAGAETDGSYRVWGGHGIDTLKGGLASDYFYFYGGRFGASDTLDGGTGARNQLQLLGDYTIAFGANQIANIQSVVLLSGRDLRENTDFDYRLTMHDQNLASGVRMTVDAGQLKTTEHLDFDGSAETNGSFRVFGGQGDDTIRGSEGSDTLFGAGGKDRLEGGAGADLYSYRVASDSTSVGYDTIVGFVFGTDRIDLTGTHDAYEVKGGGTLRSESFDADLAAAMADTLDVAEAVLFTADGGDLAGRLFLVVDENGVAGYQAGGDYVIDLGVNAPLVEPLPDFIV